MIQRLSQLFRSRNGSVTVEFSLLFILFIASLLFIAEITRLFYLSAKIDLAISEAAKTAKNTPASTNNYQEIFENTLRASDGVFGLFNGKKIIYKLLWILARLLLVNAKIYDRFSPFLMSAI